MARMARLYVPGCAHHVIQRGNNRAECFSRTADYQRYLKYLRHAAQEHEVAIHAYVLMTNHVHLLLTPGNSQACGMMMQSLGRRYVRYFNDHYGRSGTLWEGRYKSTLVDADNYFFAVTRYIELNPVRAGMVVDPAQYFWSSYHGNALGAASTLLTAHTLYEKLGNTDEERQLTYLRLFDQPVPPDVIEELRSATNKAWAFGSDSFKATVSEMGNRRAVSNGWGGDRRPGK